MTNRSLARFFVLVALASGCASTEAESSSTSGDESAITTMPPVAGSFLPGQGETAIGVYFVQVGPLDMDEARTLVGELEARGVAAGIGQLSCDQGAAEALGASPDDNVVSAAFRTRQDADAFVASWERPVLGVAEFTAFCRD